MTDTYDESTEDSIWGDIDIENAKDDPFYKPDGNYRCRITEAVIRKTKDGHKGLALSYTILKGDYEGQRLQEWKTFPFPWEVKGYHSEEDYKNEENHDKKLERSAERQMSFIKQRLKDFGVPGNEMNRLKPSQLLELPEMEITMVHGKEDRENIRGIKLIEDDDAADNYDPLA